MRRAAHRAVAVAAVAAATVAGGGSSAPKLDDGAGPAAAGYRLVADRDLRPVADVRRRTHDWVRVVHVLATGETVRVSVSSTYADAPAAARRWAEFFGALLHGRELAELDAYFAAIDEVAEICGGDSLGCYQNDVLVSIGNSVDGVEPEEVATHEYGHHLASHRDNAPWRAADWGTKRWASLLNVCSSASAGRMFPGDQGERYALNPGEGFAEAYRMLNEGRRGVHSFGWPIVDRIFFPTDEAMRAIEEDVVRPWEGSVAKATRIRANGSRRTWRFPLASSLDGQVSATLDVAAGSLYEVKLLSGAVVVGRALWSGPRRLSLSHTVCGQRRLALQVVRRSGPARFALSVAAP